MRKEFLAKFGEVDSNIDRILDRSIPAVCGVMERQITVKNENVAKIKRILKSKGFFIVGTSEPNGKTKKVWFIRSGGF